MANHRRQRTRGHDPYANFRNVEQRAKARGEKPHFAEKKPKGYTDKVPETEKPDRSK